MGPVTIYGTYTILHHKSSGSLCWYKIASVDHDVTFRTDAVLTWQQCLGKVCSPTSPSMNTESRQWAKTRRGGWLRFPHLPLQTIVLVSMSRKKRSKGRGEERVTKKQIKKEESHRDREKGRDAPRDWQGASTSWLTHPPVWLAGSCGLFPWLQLLCNCFLQLTDFIYFACSSPSINLLFATPSEKPTTLAGGY